MTPHFLSIELHFFSGLFVGKLEKQFSPEVLINIEEIKCKQRENSGCVTF